MLQGIQKQWEKEKHLLKREIDDLNHCKQTLNYEVETLKEENEGLREEKMAESLSNQAIVESLEELLEEQRENNAIEMQKLQNQVSG